MDKHMIEEMAKDMLDFSMEKQPMPDSLLEEMRIRERFYQVFLTHAEHLIKKGYRKIPEDAVMLTIKQYENIATLPPLEEADEKCSLHIMLDVVKKVERKETAEKIYKLADEIATGSQNDGVNILCAIKKEFGL